MEKIIGRVSGFRWDVYFGAGYSYPGGEEKSTFRHSGTDSLFILSLSLSIHVLLFLLLSRSTVFHFSFHDLPNYWDLLLDRTNPPILLLIQLLLLIIANLKLNLYLYLNPCPSPNLIILITWTGIASVWMET
jgi:hypothetical protein